MKTNVSSDVLMPAPSGAEGARVIVAFLAGRTAFGFTHLFGSFRKLPTLWYLPTERAFFFGQKPRLEAMEWYGRSLFSLVVAIFVASSLWMFLGRPPFSKMLRKQGAVIAFAQAAALALLIDFGYFGWFFLHQSGEPWPLPPGCFP